MNEIAEPEIGQAILDEVEEILARTHSVILYNDDFHSFDEVIAQIMKACGYERHRAEQLAVIVDGVGKAQVFAGSHSLCERVHNILGEIQLTSEVQQL